MKSQIIKISENIYDWLLEGLIPNIKSKKNHASPTIFIYLQATSKSVSFSLVDKSLKQNKNPQAVSQSGCFAEKSLLRPIEASVYSRTFFGGSFYFVTAPINLKATGLAQSFVWFPFSTLNVQQLQAGGLAQTYSQLTPIYYVNFGGQAISPAAFFEVTHSINVSLKSESASQSYAKLEHSQAYLKSIYLTSKIISQTKSLAEITREFNINSTSLDRSSSKAQESVLRPINSKAESLSDSISNINITRSLNTEQYSYAYSYTPEYKKINMQVQPVSQSYFDMGANTVLNRIISASVKSSAYSKPNISKEININSQVVSQIKFIVPEVVSRVINGVAESRSFANSIFGILKLFVSSSISSAFCKNTEYITKNIYSAMYSESYVYCNDAVVKVLSAKANTGNPFHAGIDILKQVNSSAATATLSSANGLTHQKELGATGKSSNPFHANPNLAKELQAASQTASFANTQVRKQLGLQATSLLETQASITNPEISRELCANGLAEVNIHAQGFDTLKNLLGTAECTTHLNANLLDKQINIQAEGIAQSFIAGMSNYLGSHYEIIGFQESSDLGAINLAPFNFPDEFDSGTDNPD